MLATNGNIHSLALSPKALTWGILSAFALAFYTIQPKKMLEKWDSSYVIGWGMLIAGIAISPIHPITHFSGIMDMQAIIAMILILPWEA